MWRVRNASARAVDLIFHSLSYNCMEGDFRDSLLLLRRQHILLQILKSVLLTETGRRDLAVILFRVSGQKNRV